MSAPRNALTAVLCTLMAFFVVACGSPDPFTAGAASQKVPSDSLTDWVSYSDQLSVFLVIDEEQLPLWPESTETGEGYVERAVTLHIESTLWRRAGAPYIDGEVRIFAWGWTMHEHRLRPTVPFGMQRLEVGERYLAPLTLFDRGWGLLSNEALLPLEGDVVTQPTVAGNRPSSTVEEMIGKTVEEVAGIVAAAPADPLAVKYGHLEPEERWWAVRIERDSTENGSDGPEH